MHPPIAEVPPPAPRPSAKTPPLALSVVVAIGLILGVASLLFYTPQIPEWPAPWERIFTVALMSVFHGIPLLLLWRGWGWARWLMMALCVFGLAITYVAPPPEFPPSPIEEVLDTLYIPFYVGLLIFLWTPAMRRHFGGEKAQ